MNATMTTHVAGANPCLSVGGAVALLLHERRFNVRELEQVLAAAAIRASEGGNRPEQRSSTSRAIP
jgi:O-acetyl-ADP-ribose deacetylase (regulator of RNase III)